MLKFVEGKIFCLFCATIFFCSQLNAGGMDSGGGHGIICFSSSVDAKNVKDNLGYVPNSLVDKIQSIEFLDYAYAKFPVGMRAETIGLVDETEFSSGLDLYYFLKDRLRNELPEIYSVLDQSETTFNKIGISWAPIGHKPIFDTGLLSPITDENCTLVLMAYQEPVGRAFYLQVDNRLYSHPAHGKLSQASLFLHEFLYLNARKNGEVDSSSVLALVRLLLRERLDVAQIRALSAKLL